MKKFNLVVNGAKVITKEQISDSDRETLHNFSSNRESFMKHKSPSSGD